MQPDPPPSTRDVARSFVHATYDDILRAAEVLSGIARRTAVFTSRLVDERTNAKVFFKCENVQHAGSFKFRGAYAAIASLDEVQQRLGVIANSSGNHARAVAVASRMLKVPALIVLSSRTPGADIAAVRECGAEILLHELQEDQNEIVAELVDKFGWTLIPSVDHPDIIAGYGTVAKELIEEVGPLDYLFVSVREGGLLYASSIALAQLSPQCAIIGAEYQKISPLTAYTEHAREIVIVTDNQAAAQMRFFADQADFMVEHFGSLGAAAVFDRIADIGGAKIGVILSGGNVDAPTFRRHITHTNMRIV